MRNPSFQRIARGVNAPSKRGIIYGDLDEAIMSLPTLAAWMDPRNLETASNGTLRWQDRVTGNTWSNAGSATGAISRSSVNNRASLTLAGVNALRPEGENNFLLNPTAFSFMTVIRPSSAIDTFRCIVGNGGWRASEVDPMTAAWCLNSGDKQFLLDQATRGSRGLSTTSVVTTKLQTIMVTYSVAKGIRFYYNNVEDGAYPAQTQPVGVDPKWRSVWFGTTIGTVAGAAGDKLQALRLGDILIFDDDLSAPVYAADRAKAHSTLVNWYGVPA